MISQCCDTSTGRWVEGVSATERRAC